jgi:hypothetical protein
MTNPIAPPAVQGVMPNTPHGYLDVSYGYPFSFSLTGNQLSLANVVSVQTDADFLLRGLLFVSDGSFQIRIYDGQVYGLSPTFIQSGCLPNTAGDPFPYVPEVWYPAGGRITIDIQDLSGSGNTGQILFLGANRYRY